MTTRTTDDPTAASLLADTGRCRRVVIKIGSALLVDAASGRLDRGWLAALAGDVARLRARGQEVLIVSSGAVALGRGGLGLTSPSARLEEAQAAAAIGQIRLAHAYEALLAEHTITVAQLLLTIADLENRARYLNARNTVETLMDHGVLPIINENDTVATTGWPPAWHSWPVPTCCCCCPTSTACIRPTPGASPPPASSTGSTTSPPTWRPWPARRPAAGPAPAA